MSKNNKKPVQIKQLYTVATQSATSVFSKLSQHKRLSHLSIGIAHSGQTSCEDCDVLIAGSLTVLTDVSDFLHENMQVIVCDGPLLLMTLEKFNSLDFSNEQYSYEFTFHRINYNTLAKQLNKIHSSKNTNTVTIQRKPFNVLGLLQQDNAHGDYILSLFNRVQSSFDMLARNRFKNLLIGIIEGASTEQFKEFLNSECKSSVHREDAQKFLNRLKKVLGDLRTAFELIDNGKAIESTAKKLDIPNFELTYLKRMRDSIKSANSRTEGYAAKLASRV
jgi:hypothetical protein